MLLDEGGKGARGRIFRTYKTTEKIPGANEYLVEDHRIESVEYLIFD